MWYFDFTFLSITVILLIVQSRETRMFWDDAGLRDEPIMKCSLSRTFFLITLSLHYVLSWCIRYFLWGLHFLLQVPLSFEHEHYYFFNSFSFIWVNASSTNFHNTLSILTNAFLLRQFSTDFYSIFILTLLALIR